MRRPVPLDAAPPARGEPAPGSPPRELVYQTLQTLWSAWARRRFRGDFDQVARFALFIGYPRSGHTLVGAMLNAHRHAVISHELDAPKLVLAGCTRDQLYSRILARAAWFNLRGNVSNYEYQIPNRWQGRFERLQVIGDKRGGTTAQLLAEHPDLLDRLRATVGVPLRLIHVVRNPFDNIAAIARWHGLSLDDSIDFYFSHWRATGTLDTLPGAEVITIRHEDVIRSPDSTLAGLCTFLGLERDERHLADCCSIVFERPTHSRRRAAWTADQVAEVERRVEGYSFLAGYRFEIPDEADPAPDRGPSGDEGRSARRPSGALRSVIDRFSAYLSPKSPTRPNVSDH